MIISFIAFALIPYPYPIFNASANRCKTYGASVCMVSKMILVCGRASRSRLIDLLLLKCANDSV
jgi:hypothetical protein